MSAKVVFKISNAFKKSKIGLSGSRAQVTIFIVVGLVLLGIVGILFSMSDSLKTDLTTQDKPQEDRVRFETAVKIIRDCITSSTQKSLINLALQGGADESDPAISVSAQMGQSQDSFVSLGITRQANELHNPTNLPVTLGKVRSAPISPIQNQQIKSLGGTVTLPKLCDRFGPNSPSNPDVILTCEISSYGYDGRSIQNKLAQTIQKNTIACAQKSQDLLKSIGQDVSTYFGIMPQVILGDDDVTVAFTFDTNVSMRTTNFSFHEASVKIPARYKRLYNFLYSVLDQDARNILFDKKTQYTQVNTCNYPGSSACWSEGFVISVMPGTLDSTTGKLFDIVTAYDRNSSIGGRQLTFKTAVENRRPVIDPLTTFDVASFPTTSNSNPYFSDMQLRYDAYIKNGGVVSLKPLAYDFDEEDSLQYIYSGWKGDEDSVFDTGSVASGLNGGCSWFNQDSPFNPEICDYWNESYVQPPVTPLSSNKWHDSNDYVLGDNCNAAQKCASYATNMDGTDLGPHTVNILVRDRAGLSDSLDVALIVGTD